MQTFIEFFEQFARRIAVYAGKPLTFLAACLLIVIWIITGPVFGYSDTWQLVINTGTTVITFLMIFLVQSAQNRDSKALQLKLDELIYKMNLASNVMIDIEDLTERELDVLAEKFKKLRQEHPKPEQENYSTTARNKSAESPSAKSRPNNAKKKKAKSKASQVG